MFTPMHATTNRPLLPITSRGLLHDFANPWNSNSWNISEVFTKPGLDSEIVGSACNPMDSGGRSHRGDRLESAIDRSAIELDPQLERSPPRIATGREALGSITSADRRRAPTGLSLATFR